MVHVGGADKHRAGLAEGSVDESMHTGQVTGVCGWCRAREAGGLDVEQEGQHGTGWMDG